VLTIPVRRHATHGDPAATVSIDAMSRIDVSARGLLGGRAATTAVIRVTRSATWRAARQRRQLRWRVAA
jgi:hypothetical protein